MAAMEEDATAAIDLTAEPPDVGLAWCFKSPGGFNLTGADPANRAKLKKAFFSPGSRSPTLHGEFGIRELTQRASVVITGARGAERND